MNETRWFQVSFSCSRLETISINVHKTPVECFEYTVEPRRRPPSYHEHFDAVFPMLMHCLFFTNATTPESRPRPQSSCYKTANRTPRNTTTYSMVLRSFIRYNTTKLFLFFYCTWNIKWHSTKVLTESKSYNLLKSKIEWVFEFSVSKLRVTWTKCKQNRDVYDTGWFLLSVNVLSNSISADFSFCYCVYSVLSQLSRIVPNNGDSHKIVCTKMSKLSCILEVNSTRIGIKLSVDIVYCVRSSLPHAKR